jgi:hypothetical protein
MLRTPCAGTAGSRASARESGAPASPERAIASWRSDSQLPGVGDRALAVAALRWASTVLATKPALSGFERSAIELASSATMAGARECGLLCALIAVYRQRLARSTHLGRPGETLETTVLVDRVAVAPSSRYGTVRRNDLLDADANRLVWWQTRGSELAAGQLVRVRGRVVRHTRFRGTAVTVLGYCRTASEAIDLACNTWRKPAAEAERR